MSNQKSMTREQIREAIIREMKRCSIDSSYLIRKYGIIQHPTRGKINFDLYPFQEATLNQLHKNRFNIILKSRQMGISTLVAAYSLSKMLFQPDYKVLVIATTQDVARNLVTKVKLLHDSLPSWLRKNKVDDNKLSLSLDNGSSIKAVSSAGHSGRSEALSLLIVDECAFIDKMDEIWASSQLTLATGGDAILLSTPNGTGNLFHRIWVKAENSESVEGLDKFNPVRLPWSLHPERDESWRKLQNELLGDRIAAQECDCDFLSSGHTVIPSEVLSRYENDPEMICEPIMKRGPGGDLWIWKIPNYSRNYITIVDTARGDGEDYSSIDVYDVESCEQVAEFKGKISPTELGGLAISVATEYNNATLAIENTGIGFSTVQVALDRSYPNLYYSYKNDPFLDENIQIKKLYDLKRKEDMVPGFTNSHKVRPVMISKIEFYMSEKSVIIHSKRKMQELRTFIWMNGKPQAQRGYNDDLIITLSIFLYLRDTILRMKQMGIDITRKSLQKMHKSVYTPKSSAGNPWEQKIGKDVESLKWLL